MARNQDPTAASVESVVVTARIAPDTHAALKNIADTNYRSISSHLRSLIEADVAAYLDFQGEAA